MPDLLGSLCSLRTKRHLHVFSSCVPPLSFPIRTFMCSQLVMPNVSLSLLVIGVLPEGSTVVAINHMSLSALHVILCSAVRSLRPFFLRPPLGFPLSESRLRARSFPWPPAPVPLSLREQLSSKRFCLFVLSCPLAASGCLTISGCRPPTR